MRGPGSPVRPCAVLAALTSARTPTDDYGTLQARVQHPVAADTDLAQPPLVPERSDCLLSSRRHAPYYR
jgi:hypothetical protein